MSKVNWINFRLETEKIIVKCANRIFPAKQQQAPSSPYYLVWFHLFPWCCSCWEDNHFLGGETVAISHGLFKISLPQHSLSPFQLSWALSLSLPLSLPFAVKGRISPHVVLVGLMQTSCTTFSTELTNFQTSPQYVVTFYNTNEKF